jgi:PAS domain S-box-containing protein
MKYHLTDIFNIEELKSLCESFTKLNGTVTAILDLEGNVHVATGWQTICTQFHRINNETNHRCVESDTILAGQLKQGQKYNIYKCKNGLTDIAMPIIVKNIHVGNFFTGQFFTEKPNIEYFRKQAQTFGFDEHAYLSALDNVPIFSEELIKKTSEFLVQLTETIGNAGFKNLQNIEYAKQLEIDKKNLSLKNHEYASLNEEYKSQNEELQKFIIKTEQSEANLYQIANFTYDWETFYDLNKNIVFVNQAFEKITGFKKEDFQSKKIKLENIIYKEDLSKVRPVLENIYSGKTIDSFDFRIITKSGKVVFVEVCSQPVFIEQNIMIGIRTSIHDITKRKQDEEQIIKLNRIYAVLSNINQTIVRIHDSKQLLNEACRIAIENGKFRMAWIGLINVKTNIIDVVASCGISGDYLEKINIDLNDEIRSNGPAGIAAKTGKYKISNNIVNDDCMVPWREDAIKNDYKSIASFPLKVLERTVGVFLIYSNETDFFQEEDIELLGEMAKNISFALEFIEAENQRKKANEELLAYLQYFERMDEVNKAILGTSDIEKMLNDVLNVVLSIFKCDRSWLFFPCDPDSPTFRVPMEVYRPEYPGAKILNVDLPMPPDMAENLLEALNADEPVIYIAGTEKPINKVTYEQFGVQSQMLFPIYPKTGKPWVFGMHQCSYPRVWTLDEKRLFQEISRRLSDALTSLLMFQNLQKSEAENRAIVDAVPDLLFRVQKDGIILDYRKPGNMELYVPPDQFLGKAFTDILPHNISSLADNAIKNAIRTNEIIIFEYNLIMNNTRQYFEGRVIALSKIEVLIVVRDITKRKHAESQLKQKNVEYLALNKELVQRNNEYSALNKEYIKINKELSQTNAELLKAKEKAEESDCLKTAFLQNMSHEIRTPMNAIIGFTRFLDKPALSAEKRSSFIKIIQNSTQQLLSIVTDILTISSIETKQEKINIKPICVNKIIGDLVLIFKSQALNQNISLYDKQQLNDKQAEIYTDETKLIQILTNLIVNALKFTHEGFVEFGYFLTELQDHKSQNEKYLQFYVKDTGIGIQTELHQKIFERFRQADLSISKKHGGTGLGLSISKGYIELMGGNIWVESELGKGSTFNFTIPYRPVEKNDNSYDTPKSTGIVSTILIAEDIEDNFLFIKELLIDLDLDLKLIHAKNGQETVDICKTNPNIKLVLMDIKMPVLDGYTAAKQIKELRSDIIIVAQSAYALEQEIEEFKGNAFDDYITKPIDPDELIQKVLKYIKSS